MLSFCSFKTGCKIRHFVLTLQVCALKKQDGAATKATFPFLGFSEVYKTKSDDPLSTRETTAFAFIMCWYGCFCRLREITTACFQQYGLSLFDCKIKPSSPRLLG
jgi:hypothetical protein